MMTNTAKSTLVKRANIIAENANVNMSTAFKTAWDINALKKVLRESTVAVHIEYRKKDGSLRKALGTLNFSDAQRQQYAASRENPKVVTYWDLQKGGFRCFCSENLLNWHI